MKKKLVFLLVMLFILSMPFVAKANSSGFSLDSYNTSYSSKGNLWYYGTGSIDFGVTNFTGGVARINFRRVRSLFPDSTVVTFYLDSNSGNYYQKTASVSDQYGYYYQVNRLSGYPKGTAFGR